MRTEAELREFLAFLEEVESTEPTPEILRAIAIRKDIALWCLGGSTLTTTGKSMEAFRCIKADYEPRLRKLDRRIGFFTKADYYLGAVAFALLLWAVIKAIFWE